MSEKTGIQEACDKMGGQEILAAAIRRATGSRCTQQAVSKWVKHGFAPTGRVPLIAELTGVDRKRLADPKVVEALGAN